MTPCVISTAILEHLPDPEMLRDYSVAELKKAEAMKSLVHRREQKLLNAVGAHLGKETLAIEDIISLKGRMRCEVDKTDQSESFYLDDTLLVTFMQPEFIADGDAIMVKQGYGPVGV